MWLPMCLGIRKLNSVVVEWFITRGKLNTFLFFITYCATKYQTKFYALFYYENFKQMRVWTNWI